MPNLVGMLTNQLTRQQKQWLRTKFGLIRAAWVRKFRAYTPSQLEQALTDLGVKRGDTILFHCAFQPTNGFLGQPKQLIELLLDMLGPEGNLVMMSMAYHSSTKAYLTSGKTFDVRRTASKMGIVSEIFRRRQDVLRSASPTHPILAHGKAAKWLVEGHSQCTYPCGAESPFEKMLDLEGKMLYFDLPFVGFTFVHTIEHHIRHLLPFELYEEPMLAAFTDATGEPQEIEVHVFSDTAVQARDVEVITKAMTAEGTAHWAKLGNTQLVMARMDDAMSVGRRLAQNGTFPFDLSKVQGS